ncbi:MAG: TrkH family potassium uptake protein [Clostridia bacterium]|nr:TrkH family potassium uptake protein [Clostridia bacterium]
MNYKMVFGTVGTIMRIEALLMLVPLITALIYREAGTAVAFGITVAAAFIFSLLLSYLCRTKNQTIYAKDGFAIVSLAWIILSAVGALPFVISGDITSYADAFFETASGFTTTGASILRDVESMSYGCLMWRSFTHWVGGMGVLVFVMAFIPNLADRSIHIMRAEVPGPVVGKLVPRIRDTAKVLYIIYAAMTAVQVVLLLVGGNTLFDSIVHSLGTAGTGGFGIKGDSLAGYSAYTQWVTAIFMLMFGINFNLYYLILMRKAKSAVRSTDLWTYIGIGGVSIILITANLRGLYPTLSETVRHAVFQVASIITTTGYSTVDFNLWPGFSKAVLLILMFIGGCAGSTAGGLKISRVVILFKTIVREVKQTISPRSVSVINYEGKELEKRTVSAVAVYFALYIFCILAVFLVISFEPFDLETNFSVAVSCFNNIGPAFGAAGPMASYADYSAFSKVFLAFAMLFGRLEIFPMLIFFNPRTWASSQR